MHKDISIKEFRMNLADVANRVEAGETFRVIRRSKPAFFVVKIGEEAPDEKWETVVDFTDGGKHAGIPAKELLERLKKINRSRK
ncbi:TPA: hypothetical protein HA238_05500 [Candidatus Micrarchaeota archaeon]|nr:hypothetical protein [Candidatus Micrarchaeota archaeon]